MSSEQSSINEQHVYMQDNADPSAFVGGGQTTLCTLTEMKTPSWVDLE